MEVLRLADLTGMLLFNFKVEGLVDVVVRNKPQLEDILVDT